jgi:alanine-glyoxylate transaminase/serine-glyoxylate transaminase/serine-pyruvate transaminase
MVLGALAAAELTLLDCGVEIEAGSGVGAAINQFRAAAATATAKAA